MSISLAQSCRPICITTPPGRTAASAVLRVAALPTASMTSSKLLSSGLRSRGSKVAQRACCSSEARRSGLVSATSS